MFTVRGSLVWRGLLGLLIGVIAVAWPGITVAVFVIMFAIYVFIAGAIAAVGAFSSERAGGVAGGLLLAVLDVGAGAAALSWPGITALALVWLVVIWALVAGVAELALAFGAGKSAGQRALLGLGGLAAIALAVVFAIRPDVGAVTLAQVYGLFSIITGVSSLVVAANVGHTDQAFIAGDAAIPEHA